MNNLSFPASYGPKDSHTVVDVSWRREACEIVFNDMVIWATWLCSLLGSLALLISDPGCIICNLRWVLGTVVTLWPMAQWTEPSQNGQLWLHGHSWPRSEAQSLLGPHGIVRAVFEMVCTVPDFRWHDLAPECNSLHCDFPVRYITDTGCILLPQMPPVPSYLWILFHRADYIMACICCFGFHLRLSALCCSVNGLEQSSQVWNMLRLEPGLPS